MRHPIQLPNYMGCLMEFNTILYENEFQNPQILTWIPSKLLKLFECSNIPQTTYDFKLINLSFPDYFSLAVWSDGIFYNVRPRDAS
jgi:hypothetical protein